MKNSLAFIQLKTPPLLMFLEVQFFQFFNFIQKFNFIYRSMQILLKVEPWDKKNLAYPNFASCYLMFSCYHCLLFLTSSRLSFL